MRICLFSTIAYPDIQGGAERSTWELATSLRDLGEEVELIGMSPLGDSFTRTSGISIRKLAFPSKIWPFSQPTTRGRYARLAHLYQHVHRGTSKMAADLCGFDVIHTNTLMGVAATPWRAAPPQALLVHTARDYFYSCARSNRFRRGSVCDQLCWTCRPHQVLMRSGRRPDVVCAVSTHALSATHRDGLRGRLGLDAVVRNRPQLGHEHGHMDNTPRPSRRVITLGFLGGPEIHKGARLLIEAFQGVPGEQIRLIMAGGDFASRVAMPDDGRITFRGVVSSDSFLREVDILVVPSLWNEPQGRVVSEAYQAGVSVLVSHRGGLVEEAHRLGVETFEPEVADLRRAIVAEVSQIRAGRRNPPRRLDLAAEDPGQMYQRIYREGLDRLEALG